MLAYGVRLPYVAQLGLDHIHHYDSDPHRDWDGLKHGFLILRVQIFLSSPNLFIEPLPFFRPQSPTGRDKSGRSVS